MYYVRTMANETTTESASRPVDVGAILEDAIQNPASFSVDGLSQTNRSMSDLVTGLKELRKYRKARRHPLAGMVSHLIPPGTCDR